MPIQRILGIDFGTSTSLIKVKTYEDGEPLRAADLADYVRFEGVNDTVPTLICHDETHKEYIMGHKAAANSGYGELFSNFKIDLVSDDEEVRDKAYKHVKMFFEYMYEVYDDQRSQFPTCDEEITYVSYPVKWVETDGLDEKMKSIATEAGFKNVQGMDEASAAIHSVWVQQREILDKIKKDSINVLLIDMGAGTTDLALCRYTIGEKSVERLNTWPQDKQHALFGGREIDESLWELIKEYLLSCGIPRINNERQYLPGSKAWKENSLSPALGSNRSENRCSFIQPLLNFAEELKPFPSTDRTSFEDRLKNYLEEFPNLVNGIINNTEDFTHADVDLVIFAGGHSQWYFANEMISGAITMFGVIDLPQIKSDPWRVVKLPRPHETVALGMVFQPLAAKIKGKSESDSAQEQYETAEELHKSGNVQEAFKYYMYAAEQGHADAQACVGAGYFTGECGETDYEEALKWVHKSVEQESANGQYLLAIAHYEGYGVPKDEKEAMKLLKLSAEQGGEHAQQYLGTMYENGIGVTQSYNEAFKWYQKAAEQGDAEAQNSLGVLYSRGLGVTENNEEAFKWFNKAAEQGQVWGQFNLGTMYYGGYGVKQSNTEAEKYFSLSAEQGNLHAKGELYAMGLIDGSFWKEISSEEEATMYANAIAARVDLDSFLDSARHMPVALSNQLETFEKKLPGALSYAGRMAQGEFPIFIYDFTILKNSARNGILATTKALYYAWNAGEGIKHNWSDLTTSDGLEFTTKAGDSFTLMGVNEQQNKLLHQMWQDLR